MCDQLHLVGLTGDGCRIARDTNGTYVVHHDQSEQQWERVANLPTAYAACERFSQRKAMALPRWRQQA